MFGISIIYAPTAIEIGIQGIALINETPVAGRKRYGITVLYHICPRDRLACSSYKSRCTFLQTFTYYIKCEIDV